MTFLSNFIYQIAADGSEKRLSKPNERHGPYALADWAKSQGIPDTAYDYVDNCWLKLTVQPTQLADYYRAFASPAEVDRLIAEIDFENGPYVIEAEEF